MTLSVGSRLGPYEITARLGEELPSRVPDIASAGFLLLLRRRF